MNLNVAFDMSQVGAGAALGGAAGDRVTKHRRTSIIRGLYATSWSGDICVTDRTMGPVYGTARGWDTSCTGTAGYSRCRAPTSFY